MASKPSGIDTRKTIVLITGCSAGGLGDSLAQAFHRTGKTRVFATGRNLSKLSHFEGLGIETLQLDVQSQESIEAAVKAVFEKTDGILDILVNNSGAGYNTPLTDINLNTAKWLFDLNVWAPIAVANAFTPLLITSARKGRSPMIVNHSSIASVCCVPFSGVYNASKAALSSFTDTLRLELGIFGISVVDLKTGATKSNFQNNLTPMQKERISDSSIYGAARNIIEPLMENEAFAKSGMDPTRYANSVVHALLKNPKNPPVQVWKGKDAWLMWFARTFLPFTALDNAVRKMGKMDEVKAAIDKGLGKS